MGIITLIIMGIYGSQVNMNKIKKRDVLFFVINIIFLVFIIAADVDFWDNFIIVIIGYSVFAIADIATTHIERL